MTRDGALHVAITGAGEFVGRALVKRLSAEPGITCTSLYRHAAVVSLAPPGRGIALGDLESAGDLSGLLRTVDVVVHAAARAHVMNDTAPSPLSAFRAANVDATLHLARQAAQAGVRQFVFVSSIKVNGESTLPGMAFHAADRPQPADPYAVSKHEAELGLAALSVTSPGMDIVTVRPPLVYGPGVKANFAAMMRWIDRGIPLPFGGIDNRRTLVALPNLVDLILRCITHPAAAGRVILAGDGEDVSTTLLMKRIAEALDRPSRLFTVPKTPLILAAALVGKGGAVGRLYGNLQVDVEETRALLGWSPPAAMDAVLRDTAMRLRNPGAP